MDRPNGAEFLVRPGSSKVNSSNGLTIERQVGGAPRSAAAVNNGAATNYEIVHVESIRWMKK